MKIQSFQHQTVKVKPDSGRIRIISQEFGGKSKQIGGGLALEGLAAFRSHRAWVELQSVPENKWELYVWMYLWLNRQNVDNDCIFVLRLM